MNKASVTQITSMPEAEGTDSPERRRAGGKGMEREHWVQTGWTLAGLVALLSPLVVVVWTLSATIHDVKDTEEAHWTLMAQRVSTLEAQEVANEKFRDIMARDIDQIRGQLDGIRDEILGLRSDLSKRR
jgi:hypothetical protein